MQIGIIGLKNAGKSTLFDILSSHISAAYEQSGTSRHGVMAVEDERLDFLQKCFETKNRVHPSFELLDFPPLGMIKNSAETGSTAILEEVKNCDILIQIVRQFTNPAVPFAQEGIDALGEKSALDAELLLVDLAIVENRIERIEKMKHKVRDFYQPGEPELLRRCRETLEKEEPLSVLDLDTVNEKLLRGFQFLTIKPRITIINIDDGEIPNRGNWITRFEEHFPAQKQTFDAISCQEERELLTLEDDDERDEFRKELGIEIHAVKLVAELLMKTANLIQFLTAAKAAAQSWIIPAGMSAQKAAGTIHTDMERGFIRAEVVSYDELVRYGNVAKCREKGCFRLEGKEYIVQEGDVIHFRFNV
ncbi:hypothetical protein AMJ80_10625 [bacterium SM23_31]|nr:MAG: hypothetical protein AMJ80_10625 [bacterium SM23_31]